MWAWEEDLLEECRALLFDVLLVPNVSDRWEWLPDIVDGYSVRGAYDLVLNCDTTQLDTSLELVWHKQVPLKVSVFAWWLLRDPLPTKVNLSIRGVLSVEDILCVTGCGQVGTADHLFLSCTMFSSVWQYVRDWIGFVGVDSNNISDHLVQFTYMTGVGKAKRSFLQLI